MEVSDIRNLAKQREIPWSVVVAAKREVEALHSQHQAFVDSVRQTAFFAMTGRRDRFWMIFGHVSDKTYGKLFHGGGDMDKVHGWDLVARSTYLAHPELCESEDEASQALWDFLINSPFRIPTTAELYKEAFDRICNDMPESADDDNDTAQRFSEVYSDERAHCGEFLVGTSVPF